ncbi:MAG: methylmalonyl-CoA epimerase [Chlorobium sp.]|jgi:methylmalonyl-CoA/ethylmalonyl-CoA epimerase|uniref:methylmalonyl-CoA epimerase n=1 Tax=Chlorobium sp. TaxID=1095 RepID=UPI001D729AF9|nr:methylmalonyl-CoA epimerase [Chlorobium sp.]MBN1279560.1 methylmalonyl-CoA epimerase [Chlorobiaceae bacterium]MCF8216901.1 methylmalonyl-CoA epimerase [Chlorobium sp.]MCF8271733.1 methylmalonyl-CoA epimerase [Chlorobium sp.]MCF8288121.1 methylmalonyl-CoA epimerase [Chlorobium sp.]MCF8291712.1 methylmalonyl-CoA epimerase [Chlorobium sp.]
MIKKIDHIAIAVQNLESALETFRNILGCAPEAITIEEVPSEKVRIAFIPIGETKIELLQPISDDSPISKFLQKNGDGMHHIALETDDMQKETSRIATLNLTTLGSPKKGAGGKSIVFLHPKETNRVLVEFTEHQS